MNEMIVYYFAAAGVLALLGALMLFRKDAYEYQSISILLLVAAGCLGFFAGYGAWIDLPSYSLMYMGLFGCATVVPLWLYYFRYNPQSR